RRGGNPGFGSGTGGHRRRSCSGCRRRRTRTPEHGGGRRAVSVAAALGRLNSVPPRSPPGSSGGAVSVMTVPTPGIARCCRSAHGDEPFLGRRSCSVHNIRSIINGTFTEDATVLEAFPLDDGTAYREDGDDTLDFADGRLVQQHLAGDYRARQYQQQKSFSDWLYAIASSVAARRLRVI